MLIKALCDYYDVLKSDGKVLPSGYSNVNVHCLICLTPEGEIDDVIDLRKKVQVPTGKDKVKDVYLPKNEVMPKRTEKPGIEANIIEQRPVYIFGLNYDNEKSKFTTEDRTDKAKKSHEDFVKRNLEFLEGIDSPVVNAYRKFIENWVPKKEVENKWLNQLGKNYDKYSYEFCLTGNTDKPLHEDSEIKKKWEEQLKNEAVSEDEIVRKQCAVSGKVEPIARTHGKIKGVYGGRPTGMLLVEYNNNSETSYDNKQSYNSNISVSSMKKYTEALNYLLNGKKHKSVLDDLTILYWAADNNEKSQDYMSAFLFEDNDAFNEKQTEEMLSNLVKDARKGSITPERLELLCKIDAGVDFYLAGIKPNGPRLAVKFVYRRKAGEILMNVVKHQEDMQISETFRSVSLKKIKRELISPKAKNQVADSALLTKIFRSVIYGTDYPSFLLSDILMRVKTDKSINSIRAGIIKACLNRRSRCLNKKEEIKLALDKTNTDPAYLSGRLFAVLEKLQENAAKTKLNRTIKDSCFASAAVKPALVFPRLIMLAQNHLNSLEKVEHKVYFNKLICEITDKLNGEFPEALTLTEQGKFMIGYYQQNRSFYVKKADKEESKETIAETQEENEND